MNLFNLLSKCITTPYLSAGESGNYAIRKRKETLYIFFQGSDGETDWKNNLDFPAKAYKRMGKTVWFSHRGFIKAWKEYENLLKKEILSPTYKRIVIAGYSHGGAIAALCHEYAWYHRPDIRNDIKGYGFGAPRVLWGKLPKELKERWKNFTVVRNIDDIVTHLPPALLGYRHVGNLLTVGEKGKYGSVQAHFADNYLTELAAYKDKSP